MALEDLNPAVRVEEILDGADIEPSTRLEYFMKKAANEVPKPAGSADAGKAVLVNEDGDGYELGEIPSGLPSYTSADKGKVLTIGEGEGSVTTVIVPEQMVTFENSVNYVELSNVNTDLFVEGATVTLTINGESVSTTIVDDDGLAAEGTVDDVLYSVVYDGDCKLYGYPTPSHGTSVTVSLSASVPSVEPKWENVFPPLPTANGNYILTISNGAASWTIQNT